MGVDETHRHDQQHETWDQIYETAFAFSQEARQSGAETGDRGTPQAWQAGEINSSAWGLHCQTQTFNLAAAPDSPLQIAKRF